MSDKNALRGRWGATNHDFDFRKYNTFAEQIAKEQDAQFKAAARLQKHTRDGTDPNAGAYDAAGAVRPASAFAPDIDWSKPAVKPRALPISGVPRPRFHTRGGGGTKRQWGSEPKPLASTEIGGWYGNPELFAHLGAADGRGGAWAQSEAAAAVPVSQDVRDGAALRAINGIQDNWTEAMYSVVSLEDTGYML